VRRGTNLPAVGGFNQTVILDLIRRSTEGVSRVEIADTTGLSQQTISNVARRLLDDGLITEAGKHIQGPGKPRMMLELRARSRFAVGVHLDPAIMTYVVIDLRGAIVAHSQVRTPEAGRPAEVIETMAASVEAILAASGVDRSLVIGVGIASPGPIDATRGIVVDPPLLEGWKDVPLRDALATATGMPVLLEKDVNAAAVAEIWLAGTQSENFAFFYLGTGIGIGLALGGEVLRGATGNAGEGGTLVVPGAGLPASRRSEKLGHLATPGYLVDQAVEAGLLEPRSAGHPSAESGFSDLVALADGGNELAAGILDRAAGLIGASLVTVVNLLDVDRVVFGGPFWEQVSARFLPIIAAVVNGSPDRVTRHPVELGGSGIGDDVAAVGAACLVLDTALSPRPSALLIGN
jgi:predicted NBD/HSP70 family sugar kinase